MGAQSLALVARAYGLETHWIASALLVDEAIESELKIPRGYELAFFGMVGFASGKPDAPAESALIALLLSTSSLCVVQNINRSEWLALKELE